MPDREKLIKAWNIFRDSNPYQICEGKEFRAIKDPEYCMGQMIADTIDLLKDQEKINEQFIEAFDTIRDAYYTPANRKILLNYLLKNACCCADGERR